MAEDATHGAEPQDAAAEAFEALRAEVAQLRTALEGLPTTAADYSPTLAAIAQSLAIMEAHPALRLTPDALASQVRQASEAAQQWTGMFNPVAVVEDDFRKFYYETLNAPPPFSGSSSAQASIH